MGVSTAAGGEGGILKVEVIKEERPLQSDSAEVERGFENLINIISELKELGCENLNVEANVACKTSS